MDKPLRTLSIVLLITLVFVPSVFACFWNAKPNKHYSLSLTATAHFSTVTLTAHLTFSQNPHKIEDVADTTIHFYMCNSDGDNRREIGHNITRHDGTATFQWSAMHNSNYWFIAEYVSKNKDKIDSHI